MRKEKLSKISEKLSVNRDNYMNSLRKNLDLFINNTDFTIKSLSEEADIPSSTLNNILYGNLSDCKVSTIVRLARALRVTVDELLGCGTLSDIEKASLSSARTLPEHSRYLVQWFIHRQCELQNGTDNSRTKIIPIMHLERDSIGSLHTSNLFHDLDITNLPNSIRPQIFLGLQLNCDYYMPYYSPFDTLLIANNRKPKDNENSVILYGNQVFVVHPKIEYIDGKQKTHYYSIRSNKFFVSKDDIDEEIGYIAHVIHDSFE